MFLKMLWLSDPRSWWISLIEGLRTWVYSRPFTWYHSWPRSARICVSTP